MNIDHLIDKTENFISLSQKDKVKLISYFHQVLNNENIFSAKEISDLFLKGDVTPPSNINDVFGKLLKDRPSDIIKDNGKYRLERHYIKKMDSLYSQAYSPKILAEMSILLEQLKKNTQREFLEDALKCLSAQIFRPAIIMTWLLSMDVLYDFVFDNKLSDFNQELKKRNLKYRISNKSDFEDLKESVFIEILRTISIISKEQKKTLCEKLEIRNSAAHPNNTSFKEAKVVSFIEELMTDIIQKFI